MAARGGEAEGREAGPYGYESNPGSGTEGPAGAGQPGMEGGGRVAIVP